MTATLTFDLVDETELDYVLSHTTNKVVITFDFGSGADEKKIVFTMNQFNWGEGPAELDRSGVFITLGVTGRAIYNTTDSGPIQIELTNSRTDYDAS